MVPPGRPTDVAVAVLVGVAQLGLTTLAARHRTDRLSLDLLSYLLLSGLFDQYQGLKIGFAECSGGWLPSWLV